MDGKQLVRRVIAYITAAAMMLQGTACISMRTPSQPEKTDCAVEYDGYTDDPLTSSDKYSPTSKKYHYLFKMGIAGPGLTAWDYATGKGVKVAIIDGGTNVYHQELKDKIVACYNAVTGQTGKEYMTDRSGHGSMTAGILAASGNNGALTAGIAYDASLYIVKIADENGVLNREAIADGVYWAVEQGCRIISVSVGNEVYSEAQREAIQYARDHNVLVFCSGGNTRKNEYHYPASYPEAISVAALKYSKSNGYTIAANATYNDEMDFAAPGYTVYGVTNKNNTDIREGRASSAATPYAAGVAALVLSADPSLTADECLDILKTTATDAGDPGYDPHYGYGIINPLAAVQKAFFHTDRIDRSITGLSPSYTATIDSKHFRLSPVTEGSGVLTYASSNKNVAQVEDGMVHICGIGKTTITVSIPASGIYSFASAKAVLTVTPNAMKMNAPKVKKGVVTVRWKRQGDISGYQIMIARDKQFTKKKRTIQIKSRQKNKRKIKKLPKGTSFVKMRSYKTVHGTKLYGPFGKIQKINIK